jgi:outer membrane protein assembly factor BamB
VMVADDQSRLHAFGRADGKPLWSVDTLRLRNAGSPVAWGRAFWLADRFGVLHAISKEDGRMMARVTLDGGAVSGAMRITQRGLLVQTQGGQLLLIRSEG